MSSENINITPEEARTILWEQGEAWQFLLDDLQKNIVQSFYNSDTGKELILVLGRQTGKCTISTTPIATPTGTVQIKDINIGDIVYGISDSGEIFPTEVKQVHKQGVKTVVDMLDYSGNVIATCTSDHRWLCSDNTVRTTQSILDEEHKLYTLEGDCSVIRGNEYEAETYDLGIDTENHLYLLANGLVTHNSFGLFSLAVCHAIKYGGITVTYVAPTLKMAKKITKMTLNEIISLGSPPKSCIPKFNTQDSEYNFPNGSKIELAGFNGGQIDDARGGKSHIVIVDECGFMDSHEFEYGIKSVLYPKLNSTKGIMLMCSTLPKSASHPYWNRVLLAKLENRLVEGTIYDCPRYSQEDIDKFADRVGGYETVDFKREYLNLMITLEDKAVIPEASIEKMNKIVKEVERPPFYDPYVSMDIGFRDYTAVVYGYYDYLRNTVVIEDESIIRGSAVTTSSIHETIQKKEQELWNAKAYLRVADNNNLILLNELSLPPYSLPILATAKDNREAAINKVRLLIQKETLIINPRCKHLIQQIQNATWNARRTDFDRDVLEGHQDCLAALIYLVRNVHFGRNPYPADYMMTYDTFQVPITGGFDRPKDDFQKAMKSLFNPLMNRKSI